MEFYCRYGYNWKRIILVLLEHELIIISDGIEKSKNRK